MATNRIITRVVTRNDIAERWLQFNPILLKGEQGIEIDTGKIKVGDGVTRWSELGYIVGGTEYFNPENAALLESITQENVNQWNSAQPNTIEKIFFNNAELPITDKSVSIVLPGYVDDVIEVENFDSLPEVGETGKIYVTTDNNKTYRWSGTQYTVIGGDLALGETAQTAFRGDLGKLAYDHSISEHAPVSAQENIVEIFKVAGKALPVEEKTVEIPVATREEFGVVKSSSGANKVTVESDGTMSVGVVSTSSLRVPIGDTFVLDGGSADGSDPVYPTRIENIGYNSVAEAVSYANEGDTLSMQGEISLGTGDNDHLVVTKSLTLDLENSSITGSGENGAIDVTNGTTVLKGNGTVKGTLGSNNYSMAVWANGGNVVINGGTYMNATDGTERGTDLIYASGNSVIEINGGTFIAAKPEWTLNCKDADYKAGTANIIVRGGKFYKFDPSNNATEGPNTNYVANGYKVEVEGDYYVVKPII